MENQSRNSGPEFFVGGQTAEDIRRQFIEAPLEAAQQLAVTSGLELVTLLGILPDAFLASQQRELDRLKKFGKDDDPRVEVLQASIAQTGAFKSMALRGHMRVQRALNVLADKNYVFHGFVSDSKFEPLSGLTVSLNSSDTTTLGKELAAKTDADGYFRIPIDVKRSVIQEPAAKETSGKAESRTLSERIANLFAGSSETRSAPPSGDSQSTGEVEILNKGKLVHKDPTAVVLSEGSVYREYVIAADDSTSGRSPTSNFRRP